MNEVVIGAPLSVNANLLHHFRVNVVCHGATHVVLNADSSDPYAVSVYLLLSLQLCPLSRETHFFPDCVTAHTQEPKRRAIFRSLDSGNSLTTCDLVNRIINHRQKFIERNEQKEQKELRLIQSLKNQTNGQQKQPPQQQQQQQES